ncbi:hypothetical protein N7492_010367 [Penicillium capsulatum]|uniref:Uncharacterized protein n=1 Tax=Penicillium capsulatum TaxID=69766 RepID=A0A9W9HMA9_9EURO|nr:hypothetical protein N7492_010367 [Penicillium capsulatum]KAJ6112871.1 hypothetical protein N7512_008195 [Penicillium capsulatum]
MADQPQPFLPLIVSATAVDFDTGESSHIAEVIKLKSCGCTWAKKWSRVHGDNKSSVDAAFTTWTMRSSQDPPRYLVKVENAGKAAVINFEMPGDGKDPPSNEAVLRALKVKVGV